MKKTQKVRAIEFFGLLLILSLASHAAFSQSLTVADVQTIIAQAVSKASAMNLRVTVSVTDKEGNLLGTFAMTGAPSTTLIRSVGRAGQGLENLSVPASAASHSKAGTAGIFSSGGNAFTTRTASFIIQEHFPPGIDNRPGGPLYGVQFSTLPCSDIAIAGLPLGLSGDPGGLPLYKGGVAVGGVGVEGDGLYGRSRPKGRRPNGRRVDRRLCHAGVRIAGCDPRRQHPCRRHQTTFRQYCGQYDRTAHSIRQFAGRGNIADPGSVAERSRAGRAWRR
jgi:uncharacterized protein GlcG (DUF336 family)